MKGNDERLIDVVRERDALYRESLRDRKELDVLRAEVQRLTSEKETARVESARLALEAVNRAIGGTSFNLDDPRRSLAEMNARLSALDPAAIVKP